MTKGKKSPFEDAAAEVDARLVDLFGHLGSALTEALSRLEEQGEVHHETTIDTERGPVGASAGIRIRTLGSAVRQPPGRRPERPVKSASSDAEAPEASQETPARSIPATILKEDQAWRLVAELPGVKEDDLFLGDDDGTLVIRAEARARRFEGRFPLPDGARAQDLGCQMLNGILELTWEKPD